MKPNDDDKLLIAMVAISLVVIALVWVLGGGGGM